MDWIQSLQKAINYIEENIFEDLNIDRISKNVYSSSANFQRIFSIVTGMTIGDYIRYRRLTLAGQELYNTKEKIINIALKYGYETAESFTKAFIRFHDITPSSAKKSDDNVKCFAPLSIQINMRGGFNMQRKLIPNVPVIDYNGNNAGMLTTMIGTLLQSIGEDFDKAKLTALSGEGNRFVWMDGVWCGGCEEIRFINETPFEAESRILNAMGWKAKYITVQRDSSGNYINTDAAQIRRDFVESIDKGFPVFAYLVKRPDCRLNLFFGYEDDGNEIISFNYSDGSDGFQKNLTEENKTPVAEDNWEDNISGYIILEGKAEPASEQNTALSVFKWISQHARRTNEINGKLVGFSAWESYISLLEHDDFIGLSLDDVWKKFGPHCYAISQINERRAALPYYRSLSERYPEWRKELNTAIAALEACVKNLGGLWTDEVEEFRKPSVRKKLAEAGRLCMRKDMEAVAQFEKILQKER